MLNEVRFVNDSSSSVGVWIKEPSIKSGGVDCFSLAAPTLAPASVRFSGRFYGNC